MATTPWNRVGNYRYRTEDKLGQGQFGTVYKARSVDDGGYVAIKFLSAEPEFRSQDEIDALHTLSREKAAYVVRLLEWRSMAGGSVALVFELADGSVHDLLQRMEFVKGFPAPLVIQLYYQLSTALNFIASKDLVHRDLKPGNVLYWNLPANGFLFKLGDFGGARSASIEMRSLIGTVGYACEAVINNIMEKGVYSYSPVECEMWALASMLYQFCCGRLPFEYQNANLGCNEAQRLLESAKALSGLFANRDRSHICGMVDAKGRRTYKDQLPLSCRFSNSLRRIFEDVIRSLMNAEKPLERSVVKQIFAKNLDRAKELEALRPHRILHLHTSEVVDFYPTSRVVHLEDSKAPVTAEEVLGCDCRHVNLMLPSGSFVPLEELRRLEAPSDPSQLSCVAFCVERSKKEPLRWRRANIVDDQNDSLVAKALSVQRAAKAFSALLRVPQEVANFFGRSLEDFRIRYDAFHEHCSVVTALLKRLPPRFMERLSPLIERTGHLGKTVRNRSVTDAFSDILWEVKKADYGQYDEDRVRAVFDRVRRRRPQDEDQDRLDTKMLNNMRQQLLRKTEEFSKKCFESLGALLTDETSPFEAHRSLDSLSEEIHTLCTNAFEELTRQMSRYEPRELGLDALRQAAEKLQELANKNLVDAQNNA